MNAYKHTAADGSDRYAIEDLTYVEILLLYELMQLSQDNPPILAQGWDPLYAQELQTIMRHMRRSLHEHLS